jgi:hypothetical protein
VPERLNALKPKARTDARQLASVCGARARETANGKAKVNEVAAEFLQKDLLQRWTKRWDHRVAKKLLPPKNVLKDLVRRWYRKVAAPGATRSDVNDAPRSGRPEKLNYAMAVFLRDCIDRAKPEDVRTREVIFKQPFWRKVRDSVRMTDSGTLLHEMGEMDEPETYVPRIPRSPDDLSKGYMEQ